MLSRNPFLACVSHEQRWQCLQRWTKDNSQATSKTVKSFVSTDIRKVLEFVQKREYATGIGGTNARNEETDFSRTSEFAVWATKPISIKIISNGTLNVGPSVWLWDCMKHVSHFRPHVVSKQSFRLVTCYLNVSIQCYWVSTSNKSACVPLHHANRKWRQLSQLQTSSLL